jgi:hypothetical protein
LGHTISIKDEVFGAVLVGEKDDTIQEQTSETIYIKNKTHTKK